MNTATQGESETVSELRAQVESLSTALTHAGAQVRRLETAATQQQLEVGAQGQTEKQGTTYYDTTRSKA